jgi:deazaflavin-dependent oxidoreductase (nitroreductase family)
VSAHGSWWQKQAEVFEASDGAEANTLNGVPIVLVTMKGARTGEERKVPLMRVEHEGSYALVASKGGAAKNPAWYHNLVAHPNVRLQDGPVRRHYVAREVLGEEREEWWRRASAVWHPYPQYQAKTTRQIPVFVLTPVSPA